MTNMSERILELKKLSGLNSTKIAELCGWKVARYSHYETGKRKISVEDAVTLCDSLAPFIGDKFLYLTKGLELSDYIEAKLDDTKIDRNKAFTVFNDVVARARRLREITVSSDKTLDNLAADFSTSLAEIMPQSTNVTSIKKGA